MLDQYFPTMPDVSGLLQNVTRLAASGFKDELLESTDVLNGLQRSLQAELDQRAPALRIGLASIGNKLSELAKQISSPVDNAINRLQKHVDAVDRLQEGVNKFNAYRQYLGVAAALCVLLMVALLAWGLLVGVCGGRPEVYGAHDCCSKAGGARSLLCGVAVVFTLGGFVALVFALNFAVGVLSLRFVCDPLTYPLGNRLFHDVDQMVDLERTLYGNRHSNFPSLTSVLVQCHRNFTIYEMLRLQRILDLENLPVLISPEYLEELLGLATTTTTKKTTTTTTEEPTTTSTTTTEAPPTEPPAEPPMTTEPPGPEGRGGNSPLRQLAESGLLEFDFDRILDALETNMTSLSLDGLARQLNSTAASLARPQWAAEARDLARAAAQLDALGRRVLAPMQRDAAALNETVRGLRDSLPRGPELEALLLRSGVGSAIAAMIKKYARQLLRMVLQRISQLITEKLTEFLKHVTFYVRYNVGHCGPLSSLFNATRDSLCVKVVQPVNGYWMALGWCILLFVPLMVTARRLAELYMQVDPYPGPLVEAAYKAEKRAGREGREGREMRESRELRARRGGGGGAGRAGDAGGAGPARADSPLAPPLDAYHARRYTDMAPKHWEEGPPRYHGPTEYERPPPYYYPGPNDRQ